jgi:hypothetical protein
MLLVISVPAIADDADFFCKYAIEQGIALRDQLLIPSAIAGFLQPETGLPPQALFGVQDSLASYFKSKTTMQIARENCDLYRSASAAQSKIQYALPALEKQALMHRVSLLQDASKDLDILMSEQTERVRAQVMTRPALYNLQVAAFSLASSLADTGRRVAEVFVPESLSAEPINALILQKEESELQLAKATNRLVSEGNWDITASAGVHQQLWGAASTTSTDYSGFGPFATIRFSYNFGRRAINRHLDRASEAYAEWKKQQPSEVTQSAAALREQIKSCIQVEEYVRRTLLQRQADLTDNLHVLEGVDTAQAEDFRDRLLADRLLLRVELEDVDFRLATLKQYQAENFQ